MFINIFLNALLCLVSVVVAAHNQCPARILNETGLGAGETYLKAASSWASCCDLCSADRSCRAWTFVEANHGAGPCLNGQPCCVLRTTEPSEYHYNRTGKVAGVMPAPPPPAPSPAPPPVPAGSQKNIVFITTDDQDLMMGSMRALPHTRHLLMMISCKFKSILRQMAMCLPNLRCG